MSTSYLDAIRTFEGFAPQARWDYAQHTNGYGTKALYAGEVIGRAEADRRFESAVAGARLVVERYAPGADEGTKAALTSLTYNAGDSWVRSGLGQAVQRGDLDQVKEIFTQYNKAGGQVLPALVSRRAAEALWIGNQKFSSGDASAVANSVVVAQQGHGMAIGAVPGQSFEAGAGSGAPSMPLNGAGQTDEIAQADRNSAVGSTTRSPPLLSSEISEVARLMKFQSSFDLIGHRFDRDKDEQKQARQV